jgi:hypothetical protein
MRLLESLPWVTTNDDQSNIPFFRISRVDLHVVRLGPNPPVLSNEVSGSRSGSRGFRGFVPGVGTVRRQRIEFREFLLWQSCERRTLSFHFADVQWIRPAGLERTHFRRLTGSSCSVPVRHRTLVTPAKRPRSSRPFAYPSRWTPKQSTREPEAGRPKRVCHSASSYRSVANLLLQDHPLVADC